MSTLELIRQQLDQVITEASADLDASLAARAAELDRREADLARAIELATTDTAAQAAYRQGGADQRQRVQRLIQLQLEHLAPNCGTRTVLHTLSRMVEGEP
jgi:hypothetical protein